MRKVLESRPLASPASLRQCSEGSLSIPSLEQTADLSFPWQPVNLMSDIASETRSMESLLEASRAVLRYTNFQESARAIFNEAKKMTGATAGYVALLSETGEENEILFLDSGNAPCSVNPELPMPIRGLRAEAYHTQRTVFENHFWESEWRDLLPEGHMKMANVLFAPLNVEGKTVGIMGLANKPSAFTAQDATLASAFGEFAAIALANSRTLEQLRTSVEEMERALAQVKTLKGIIPICMRCRSVRDDEGYWSRLETYLSHHTGADVSHGLCPACAKETEAEWALEMQEM